MSTRIEYPHHRLQLMFLLSITAGVVLHLLQLPSLLPQREAGTIMLLAAWPQRFYFWTFEALAWLLAGTALALNLFSPNLPAWYEGATPTQRARALGTALVLVQLLLGLGFWLTRDKGADQLRWLRAAFWMGGEFRIPAIFASLQLWFAAWLSFQCYRLDRAIFWFASALVCTYLGFDELLSFHEAVGVLLKGSTLIGDGENTLSVGPVRTYFWPLVFLPLLLVMSAWFLVAARRAVGPRALWQLVLAGLVFATGALGFEIVEANGAARLGEAWFNSTPGQVVLLAEESFETLGVTLAVVVFARHRWQTLAVSRGVD
ncbi:MULTISPECIES: hypothetical protein [Methylocaldum]|uniref:hypothetical protein n=1 Tax=unclassified Methylocaldum TaxID=2622260 RepID=UPI000A31EA15|nr:hypothetical protein [Methylocaldum sp. RMAD-M]MBP1150505.1 hypothetical protein [Methylocaldum sp. RMAD-M]MVF23615.1 hypothetical protein [Methylocaldum sp. BRCS4]